MFKKKIVYKECIGMNKQCNALGDSSRNYEAQANRIVVKKVSFVGKVFELILDLIYRLGKILFWVAIFIVLSIGVTAIVNPEIRGIIFNYLPLG